MKTEILVLGRHEEILEILLRLVNKNEAWNGTAATSNEEATRMFSERVFDLVLLSSGIDEESEIYLCNYFRQLNPSIIIVQHYGGGSGLLTNEILQALEHADQPGRKP